MDIKRLIRVAQGLEPADLVLKNAEVFHGYTGEFLHCDVAICDGYIAGTGSYFGIQEINMEGKYLTPGFIDSHVHIESSMLTPEEFAKAAIPCGTTTVIIDPHEIANVVGTKGIQYMLDASEKLPLNVYVMLPSCVPATPLEDSGACLLAEDLKPFLQHPRVLGLAEMMNAPGVLSQSDDVLEKLQMAGDYQIDGHAPGLTGSKLMGYSAAGINSDHECFTPEQAMERLRAGMHVMLREGTAAKTLRELLPAINPDTAPYFMFCADDKIPAELLENGYINEMVQIAVKGGVSVANALQIATINPAKYFKLKDVGLIAPGYKADILVFDALNIKKPKEVYKSGRKVYDSQKGLLFKGSHIDASAISNTVHLGNITMADFAVPLASDMANVIGLVPYQIVTKKIQMEVKRENGYAVSDLENDVLKILVFERHHSTGRVGKGLVKGFGLKKGALASTVAHDSHNLITIGTNDEDMMLAVKELERIGGGICIAADGKILGSLPLPVGGLMTNAPAAEVAAKQAELITMARELGVPEFYAPFLTMAFLSLPVIPALKLTDKGLIDVDAFKIIPLEANY